MYYMKPPAIRDNSPDEKLVAQVALCSSCCGILCSIGFIIMLIILIAMAPQEGDVCPEGAYECPDTLAGKTMLDDEYETCECWNNTYFGRRRGGSAEEKEQQNNQNNDN